MSTELVEHMIAQKQSMVAICVGGFMLLIALILIITTYLSKERFSDVDLYTKDERKQMRQEEEEEKAALYAVSTLLIIIGGLVVGCGTNAYMVHSVHIERLTLTGG